MKLKPLPKGTIAVFAIGLTAGVILSQLESGNWFSFTSSANAQEAKGKPEGDPRTMMKDPTGTISNPYMYYAKLVYAHEDLLVCLFSFSASVILLF